MPEDKFDDLTLETATSRVNAPDVNIERLEEKISAVEQDLDLAHAAKVTPSGVSNKSSVTRLEALTRDEARLERKEQAIEVTLEQLEQSGVVLEQTAADRKLISDNARQYLLRGKGLIRDLAIHEATLLDGASVRGSIVAETPEHIAVATSSNSFAVLERKAVDGQYQVGGKVSVTMANGRAIIKSFDQQREREL